MSPEIASGLFLMTLAALMYWGRKRTATAYRRASRGNEALYRFMRVAIPVTSLVLFLVGLVSALHAICKM